MSLRDALLKSGAVSKKRKTAIERQLKQERKKKQGNRKRKSQVNREQREADKQAEQARLEQLKARRAERDRLDALVARNRRVTHLLHAHHLRLGMGKARFFFVGADGRVVRRLWVPWKIAHQLRAGALAIAVQTQLFGEDDYVVIPRDVALQVRALNPRVLVFFNEEPGDAEAPESGFIDDYV